MKQEVRIDNEDLVELSTKLILGASEFISLKGHWERQPEFGISLDNIASLVDNRLLLRCLLPLPFEEWKSGERIVKPSSIQRLQLLTEQVRRLGWQVRIHPNPNMLVSSLIVDNRWVLSTEWLNFPAHTWYSEDPKSIQHYSEQFDLSWSQSEDISALRTLYADVLLASPEEKLLIAKQSQSFWSSLITELSNNPKLLLTLEPRKFEELIAELLAKEGLEVSLTPQTRDGGRDILAFQTSSVGNHLFLVECKRYAPERPVDVSLVRALYGTVTQERATAGILVTTSYFTKDAISFRESIKYQLGLRDYDSLTHWIKKVVDRRG